MRLNNLPITGIELRYNAKRRGYEYVLKTGGAGAMAHHAKSVWPTMQACFQAMCQRVVAGRTEGEWEFRP